jgi:Protein of unknown function (DUF4238)
MDHKNQHWIPRSYIKAWCDPEHRNKVVHIYNADGAYKGWRPYSRIFSTDNLYTVMNGKVRDVRTEKAFTLIEDKFLKVRTAIERNQPLPAATKPILALFVAAIRNRSPAARDHWQSFQNEIVAMGDQMAVALSKASPAERQRMARASLHRSSDRSRSMTLEQARSSAAEPFGKWVLRHVAIEAQLLEKMSFAIMKAPEGIGFITSDSPVVWHDAAPPGQRRRRIGLGYPSIEVSLPLSPRHCLLFDHLGKDGTCDVSQDTVDAFNSRTLGNCDGCFVAQSSTLAVDWFEDNS